MKRAVLMLLVIAICRCGGRGAEKRYQDFAEEMLRRRYDAAATMCEGLSAQDLAQLGTQERIGAGPSMFQTLFKSRFDVQSRETSGPDVTLHAVQTVFFNPPGVESARPTMYATMQQTTTLRKSGGDWKVVRFENEFQKMDSWTGRP